MNGASGIRESSGRYARPAGLLLRPNPSSRLTSAIEQPSEPFKTARTLAHARTCSCKRVSHGRQRHVFSVLQRRPVAGPKPRARPRKKERKEKEGARPTHPSISVCKLAARGHAFVVSPQCFQGGSVKREGGSIFSPPLRSRPETRANVKAPHQRAGHPVACTVDHHQLSRRCPGCENVYRTARVLYAGKTPPCR